MNKKRILLLVVLVLVFSLACSFTSLLPGSSQMEATAMALQATQTALDMQVAQIQQQQTEAAKQPDEAEAQAAAPDGTEIIFEDIRFVVDPAIAASVDPAIRAEMEDIVGIVPEHVEFILNGYAWNDSMHTPTIYIYPVDTYRGANEYVDQIFDDLNGMLQDRPGDPESIPFLPMWNAGQMFTSHVEYLDFENGSGVRFLTMFGQAIAPINNNGLFYTFQGLTNDGQWYVAAVFPAAHPSLPPNGENPPGGDWEAFGNQYEQYMNETVDMLNAQSVESFTPNLTALDELVRTMRVK